MNRHHSSCALNLTRVGCIYKDSDIDTARETISGVYVHDFKIPRGKLTAILGESGSGKSTFLGLAAGLRRANHTVTDSQIDYFSNDGSVWDVLSNGRPQSGEIAFVFQEAQLIKAIPAKYNAEMPRKLAGSNAAQSASSGLVERLKLSAHWSKLSENLSGGQAQRVAIIRAVAVNPNLIFCDEPTSSLDDTMSKLVLEALRDWAEESDCAVVWVTHELALAASYAHQIALVAGSQVFCDDATRLPWDAALFGDTVESRKIALEDLIDQGRSVPALTQHKLSTEIQRPSSAQQNKKVGKNKFFGNFGTFASYGFVVQCGWFEIAKSLKRSAVAPNLFSRLKDRIEPLFKSITIILFLGLTVFYFLSLSQNAIEKKIEARLAEPSYAHFTLEPVFGGPNLTVQKLLSIEEKLFADDTTSAKENNVFAETEFVSDTIFGRHELLLKQFWFPDETEDGTCASRRLTAPYDADILVFDEEEPLFQTLPELDQISVLKSASEQTSGLQAGDSSTSDLVIAWATTSFMKKYRLTNNDRICMKLFSEPIEVSFVETIEKIPGSGKKVFHIAMARTTHDSHFARELPVNFQDGQGNITPPLVKKVAVYFSPENFISVACRLDLKAPFDWCEGRPATVSGFKPNRDILDQVKGILDVVSGARSAFAILAITFALTIILSTALAISAFVQQNEKSIAVMRAFGYSALHLIIMVLTQITVLLTLAFGLFCLVLLVFHFGFAAYVAKQFGVDPSLLSLQPDLLWASTLRIFLISLLVDIIVVASWWLNNRYLSETLQKI